MYSRSDGSPLGVQGDKGAGPVSESRKTRLTRLCTTDLYGLYAITAS